MKKENVLLLVLAGLLCAVGLVVPMFMPKVVLGAMSFTLASHVATFLAVFISPALAVAVCVGTTLGFIMTTPLIIALRAASHIAFALIGAMIVVRKPQIIDNVIPAVMFNLFLAFIHAAGEVAVVTPFFFDGVMFKPEQLANGFVTSVLFLVGCGTFLHSVIDFCIALFIWKPLSAALPSIKKLRKI